MGAIALAAFAVFAAAQLVPYGRAHHNPPVLAEPAWSSREVEGLARRACYDCHSHHTRWPSYAYVAPASWLVQRNVDRGRAVLNFSAWEREAHDAEEAVETVLERSMPPREYLLLHPEAALTPRERLILAGGLEGLAAPGETEHHEAGLPVD